jgi:hypothetical protein
LFKFFLFPYFQHWLYWFVNFILLGIVLKSKFQMNLTPLNSLCMIQLLRNLLHSRILNWRRRLVCVSNLIIIN